jgi:hypothetical protein
MGTDLGESCQAANLSPGKRRCCRRQDLRHGIPKHFIGGQTIPALAVFIPYPTLAVGTRSWLSCWRTSQPRSPTTITAIARTEQKGIGHKYSPPGTWVCTRGKGATDSFLTSILDLRRVDRLILEVFDSIWSPGAQRPFVINDPSGAPPDNARTRADVRTLKLTNHCGDPGDGRTGSSDGMAHKGENKNTQGLAIDIHCPYSISRSRMRSSARSWRLACPSSNRCGRQGRS